MWGESLSWKNLLPTSEIMNLMFLTNLKIYHNIKHETDTHEKIELRNYYVSFFTSTYVLFQSRLAW